MANLVASSASEDKYGAIHRDVPLILEILAKCHISIRSYQSQITSKYTNMLPTLNRLDGNRGPLSCWKILHEPNVLLTVIDTCIYRIITTYYSHLERFEFEPEYASVLERFMEFHE